jgi:hypothetical protein
VSCITNTSQYDRSVCCGDKNNIENKIKIQFENKTDNRVNVMVCTIISIGTLDARIGTKSNRSESKIDNIEAQMRQS